MVKMLLSTGPHLKWFDEMSFEAGYSAAPQVLGAFCYVPWHFQSPSFSWVRQALGTM